ncbi:MAG TPA: hypothetical protein VMJ10_07830 [Kofleriaceae bacterium]|nr:hypothetical protein [Kofleriaceae bacterium]
MRICGAWLVVAAIAGGCGPTASATCKDPSCAPDGGGGSDAGPPPIDAAPDAPLLGFGQPCTDKSQCQSNLCIIVPTGGLCTQACGTCPPGWGCYDVGQMGEIQSECVPITSELCTPCMTDTECTQVGMDKCLTEPDGSYCARDCSNISCPTGYDCTAVNVNGSALEQCLPHSGACDCNTAAQMGTTNTCEIMTTFGRNCAGTETCGGTGGWSTCAPPSTTDVPDGSYTDDNCDGIDGDITKGIFVSNAGADTSTCGLVYTSPCQTISYSIVRAVLEAKQNVYVQAGTYNEVVVLQSGVNIWGGYDATWIRNSYATPGHTVTIVGKQDTTTGGDGEWLAVRAHNLIVPVTIGDVIIQGPNASGGGGNSGLDGHASYGVHVYAGSLNLVRVQLLAGTGATGSTGTPGSDAVIADAQSYMTGGKGGDGAQYSTACDDSSRGGGGAIGTNSCTASPSGRAMNGGNGGRGGTMDSDCSFPDYDFDATAGASGTNAAYTFGTFGTPGSGGSGTNVCGPAGNGDPGLVVNGAAGGVNNGGYVYGNGYWYARAGGSGGTGENGGGGGGGGGGAGGCDNGTDSYGGGGGGGGAGGCAARGGGGGGGGGGGSFALFAASSSTVTMSSCELVLASGGAGGTGGTGGRGQSGGASGAPGARQSNGSSPGTGGAGAHGGHGGGGGGGQGGRAVGIGWTPDSNMTETCTFSGGAPGLGGSGGASAPSAPASERDGNAGSTGTGGSVDNTRECTSTTSC